MNTDAITRTLPAIGTPVKARFRSAGVATFTPAVLRSGVKRGSDGREFVWCEPDNGRWFRHPAAALGFYPADWTWADAMFGEKVAR